LKLCLEFLCVVGWQDLIAAQSLTREEFGWVG